jgi:protein-S-isoprenylcysteine O-methyltransferase Ste14
MTVSILAALVHVASLFFQWRGGFISFERPRLGAWEASAADFDRRSSTVWDAANALEVVGLVLGFVGVGRMEVDDQVVGLVGLGTLLVGIAIRWTAIRTLGTFFTGSVTIQPRHELVRRGLYRHIRHPAYTGTLVAHFGLGLAFVSWVTVVLSTVPFFVAAMYRIRVEEHALRQKFGTVYSEYAEGTWRLIPGVY